MRDQARTLTRGTTRRAALTLALVAALLPVLSGLARADAGDLDPSFDGDGRRTLSGLGLDYPTAVLVQPDGKIVVAGIPLGPASDFAIARLHPDGGLDAGFDDDGLKFVDFDGGYDVGEAVALQPDGKLIVAGHTTTNDENVAVARLHPGGSLDESFDPGDADGPGKAIIDFGGAGDRADDVLVQPDGKLLLAGSGGSTAAMAVARLHPKGSLDDSFDGNGIAFAELGADEFGYGVALDAQRRIVVAGTTANSDGVIARFKPTGGAEDTLDTSFSGTGIRTLEDSVFGIATDVLVQPDGKLVVTGSGAGVTAMPVSRLNPDGSDDETFGEGGAALADFGGNELAAAALLQPDGKIVLVGATTLNGDIAIARLLPGGTLDTTFADDGRNTINFGGSDYGLDGALQADGKVVVVGPMLTGGTTGNGAIARLQGDPPASGDPGQAGQGAPGAGGSNGGSERIGAAPRCDGKPATIVGTSGRDKLRGTRRADVIVALGGNDSVRAGPGNDLVCGGDGNDRLAGGPGADRVTGNHGKDLLSGGPGRDRLAGGTQHDNCVGGAARDRASACETKRGL